jgi:uncharacterized surface protein with fasciclin (FAS1) repeats
MNKTLIASAILTACMATACSPKQDDADTAAPAADTSAMADSTTADAAGSMQADAPAADAAAPADKDIVDTASGSPDHSTLVAAVQAAGLVDTLKGAGPFTVFAPTNAAFDALPAGTVDGLLKPDKKADLTKILTYHVVPGNVDAAALTEQITAGGGSATLNTVQGEALIAKAAAGGVTITDAKGNIANVTTADLKGTNGIIHVVDKVLMP